LDATSSAQRYKANSITNIEDNGITLNTKLRTVDTLQLQVFEQARYLLSRVSVPERYSVIIERFKVYSYTKWCTRFVHPSVPPANSTCCIPEAAVIVVMITVAVFAVAVIAVSVLAAVTV
jgi:hypothetical protein